MSKTKVFISTMPFLGKKLEDGTIHGILKLVKYKPIGNPKLEYPNETRFPIIPVINGYTNEGDTIRVIAILTDGDESNAKYTQHNYDTYFEPEIKKICDSKRLILNEIEILRTLDREDMDTQLKLFSDIADKIHNEEEIYACITYGTKPMPIILTLALNYACKLKKNVSVGCTVYGRFPHVDEAEMQGNALIYDTTSLFYMDSIISKLAEIKVRDPAKAIKFMLGIEPAEDD